LPVITAAGVLEVGLAVPNGGVRDLGATALSAAQFPAASDAGQAQWQPQGLFQQGHTYLMKLGNQLALVRVARIRSSVDPRLAAIPNGAAGAPGSSKNSPSVSRGGSGNLLGDMRDQQQMDRVLNSAQISIDLEWLRQQPNQYDSGVLRPGGAQQCVASRSRAFPLFPFAAGRVCPLDVFLILAPALSLHRARPSARGGCRPVRRASQHARGEAPSAQRLRHEGESAIRKSSGHNPTRDAI
jgi:hypothetical protein